MTAINKGSYLCGRVTFVVTGELTPPDACHCVQCRKHSGHYFASTDVPKAAVAITGQENLTWYHSSAKVRRGFCSTCGSSLFFNSSNVVACSTGMSAGLVPFRILSTNEAERRN